MEILRAMEMEDLFFMGFFGLFFGLSSSSYMATPATT
jgi:hypothetical protein